MSSVQLPPNLPTINKLSTQDSQGNKDLDAEKLLFKNVESSVDKSQAALAKVLEVHDKNNQTLFEIFQ